MRWQKLNGGDEGMLIAGVFWGGRDNGKLVRLTVVWQGDQRKIFRQAAEKFPVNLAAEFPVKLAAEWSIRGRVLGGSGVRERVELGARASAERDRFGL
ncbi:unnamed protein product, partial [Anisakis simplex]